LLSSIVGDNRSDVCSDDCSDDDDDDDNDDLFIKQIKDSFPLSVLLVIMDDVKKCLKLKRNYECSE